MSYSNQGTFALTDGGTSEVTSDQKVFQLDVPGRLPSWNQILAMEQWARYKFKGELAASFLSALRASAGDCLTRTTCAKSTMSTFADTLALYLATKQAERASRSAKKKLALKKQSLRASKSLPSKPPF